jgi:hypothetical protein
MHSFTQLQQRGDCAFCTHRYHTDIAQGQHFLAGPLLLTWPHADVALLTIATCICNTADRNQEPQYKLSAPRRILTLDTRRLTLGAVCRGHSASAR